MPKILRGSMLTNNRKQLIREISGHIDETGCRFVYLVPTTQLQNEIKIALFQYIEEMLQGQGDGVEHFSLPDPHIYLFDGFINEILKNCWEYQPPIQAYQQRMILKMVTDELDQAGQLSVLQGMVEYDGFYTSLIQWLKEVKKTGQSPVEWLQYSQHSSGTKESQLGLIYQQYEEFLDLHDLVDEERNYEKAIQRIVDSNLNQLELVVIDGFYKLNQLQIRLVKSLIDQDIDVWVNLVQGEERESIFLSTTEMVDQLLKIAEGQEWEWTVSEFVDFIEEEPSGISIDKSSEERTPVLKHLTQNLFNLSTQSIKGAQEIQILHMPDPYQEIEQIGRMIKKAMLADDSLQADQIAVILRNVDSYHFYIEEIFHELGIPYQISVGSKLSKLPIFKLILKVYRLFAEDWSRESFLEILKSSYLQIADAEEIEQFEHMILEAGIIKGEQEWLTKLRRFDRRLVAELRWVAKEEQSLGMVFDLAEGINSDQLSEIEYFLKEHIQKCSKDSDGMKQEKVNTLLGLVSKLKKLRHFLAFLQPLIKNLKSVAQKQSLYQHCQSLLQLFSTYQLGQQVVKNLPADQQHLLRRDLVSLDQLQNLLVEIIHFGELLNMNQKHDCDEAQLLSYSDFLNFLKAAADEVHIPEPQLQLEGVQVLTSLECRGRKFKLVFLSGLVEGECPYYGHKDWLFKPEERKALKALGIHFQQFYERLEEERLFFLEAVSTAREKLVLTCPAWQTDETVQSSSFIEEVLNLFTDDSIQRRDLISRGFGVTNTQTEQDQPLTRRELDESYLWERWLMNEGARTEVAAVDDTWDKTLPLSVAEWERLDELYRRGEMIQQREGNEFSQYDGLLKNEEIQKELSKKYHKDRMYSISELNSYAVCPFQFFGNRILGLEQVEEPTLRLEPLDLGNLYHQILYCFFKEFPGWEEEPLEVAVKRMEVVAKQEMIGYLPGESLPDGLWSLYQEEILEKLNRILTYEYEEAAKQGFQMLPTYLEASFGRLKDTYREIDSLNLEEPVILRRSVSDQDDDEITVKFKGKIDRIDFSRDGRYVIIYDYKFGSRDGFTDMEAGIDLQLPIYIRAAQLLCGEEKEVLGAGYFALLKCDRKSGIWRDSRQDLIPVTPRSKSCLDEESWQEILTQVDQYVIDYVQRIRQGDFRVNPAKCPDYCKFKKICRYDQTRIRLKDMQNTLREGGDSNEL